MDSGLCQRDKRLKINREALLTFVRSECTTTKNVDEGTTYNGYNDYERTTRKEKAIEILHV